MCDTEGDLGPGLITKARFAVFVGAMSGSRVVGTACDGIEAWEVFAFPSEGSGLDEGACVLPLAALCSALLSRKNAWVIMLSAFQCAEHRRRIVCSFSRSRRARRYSAGNLPLINVLVCGMEPPGDFEERKSMRFFAMMSADCRILA